MIRIESMTLRLPVSAADPRAVAGDIAKRIARALEGTVGRVDRLTVIVEPGQDAGVATARVLHDELSRAAR